MAVQEITQVATPIHYTGISIPQRRLLVLILNVVTTAPLLWAYLTSCTQPRAGPLDILILICATICVPWPVVTFWNTLIGLCIVAFGKASKSIYPYFEADGSVPELASRTALTIFMRNEDPEPTFNHLQAMHESLRRVNRLQHFRFVVLSDTTVPDVAQKEEECFSRIRQSLELGMFRGPVYRRREKNVGFKAGNIKDYLDKHSEGDDFFVPLDSDSAMSGDLLSRLVFSMEKHHQIGLLQTLVVGMPAVTGGPPTARCTGATMPYNAIIRKKAFHENCMLPKLPGGPPLGGYILSHDLMETMSMRRAGYEVRLLPIETESYETNPPTFLDYIRRELRWCQGTMQYWFLLNEPGLNAITRFQVCQTITTYLSQACWVAMTLAYVWKVALGEIDGSHTHLGFTPQLILVVIGCYPKIAGLIDTAMTSFKRYGGISRCLLAGLVEFILMTLIGPATAVSVAVFLIGLLMGKSISWDGQNRNRLGLSWRDTSRVFWPQFVIGISCAVALYVRWKDAESMTWALPLVVGLCLNVPFAVITASPRLGRLMTRLRWFMIPEEFKMPALLSLLVDPETASAHTASHGKQKSI
ncbi:glucosyltransferase [Colletotrichum asianum]|uniref:Glucans biosynthesis glucosyltransferase H n=1 Tax=Colletotrichum asianum TaxID=702518 RepID=A0A8H3ZKN8_9PEZI|nr:glucosyltransferase [Colletotrichum asianum]